MSETPYVIVGGLFVLALLMSIVLTIKAVSQAEADERRDMEGPRNKAIQNLMEGKKVVSYWQPLPPKGDIYIEMDDGTLIKFHSKHQIEVYAIQDNVE